MYVLRPACLALVLLSLSTPVRSDHHGRMSGHASSPDLTLTFPAGTSMVEVPLRDMNGGIVIDVRINGSEPIPMLLDTGWQQAGFLMTDDIESFDFASSKGGGPHQMGKRAEDVVLVIGGLRLEGAVMEVTAKTDEGVLGMLPEDGILGGQFFKSLIVEVDWEAGRVRFHDPAGYRVPEDLLALPLENRNGYIYASGTITVDGNPKPGEFIIDTGSSGSLYLRADRFAPPARRVSGVTIGESLFGPIKGDLARVDRLELGGTALAEMVAYFVDGSSNMIAVGADGNLGTQILRRFDVTFDYSGNRVLLRPTSAISDPFPFSTSGMAVERKVAPDGSIGVVQVYPGSPAATAGLAPGDRILSLGARPIAELGPEEVRSQLRQAPGTRLKVSFRRGETTQEVELLLKKIL